MKPKLRCINCKGNKIWVNHKDQYHRKDGPAIEYITGGVEYWREDLLHREDGPAVIYANGNKEYWIDGIYYQREKDYWLKIYQRRLITKKDLFLKCL